MISLIWAEAKNHVIAKQNVVPWTIKEEMNHFVAYTNNKAVLMGRKTWDSLRTKPLKGRKNYVLTRNKNLEFPDGVVVLSSEIELNALIKKYTNNSQEELVIIGGSGIFNQLINQADQLVVSYLFENYDGDLFAPKINLKIWKVVEAKTYRYFQLKIYQKIN